MRNVDIVTAHHVSAVSVRTPERTASYASGVRTVLSGLLRALSAAPHPNWVVWFASGFVFPDADRSGKLITRARFPLDV
ncbi:unannotated protein [freshwater metagenome]|uniref:Unannotated protein n=1 Tax=freshwater metagenome TaxID=449393 RepID=A0A6J6YXT2_9ZZZZ